VVGCLPSDPILQGLPGIKGILQVIGGAGGGGRGDLIFAALETVRSHEVDRVCGEPIRVLRRIGAKRVGDLSKAVARKGVGDDQDAEVAAMILESLHGQAEEIVPIAGDETPALARGPVELLSVREALGADVVNAYGVDTAYAEELGHGGADVLVEVVLHCGASTTRAG